MNQSYQDLLNGKIPIDIDRGMPLDLSDLNPALKPLTHSVVEWAFRGGCRALFLNFGLHKTASQLELMRLVGDEHHRLIVLPLGVRQEFFADAEQFFTGEYAVSLKFIRSDAEIDDPRTIYLTNYNTIRESKIGLTRFKAVSLDEADVLRSRGSKQFGEMLFGPMQQIPLRWVATATPSPNEYLEIISYAHFLGVMDMGESKTRFFKRDSEHADKLTLHPHKEQEFWMWVKSWALFVLKPSDLGYSDEGYDQPPLDVRWHEVPTDHSQAGSNKTGQGLLLKESTAGVSEEARESRESLPVRLAKALEIRDEDPAAHRIIWHDLEAEREALESAIPGLVTVYGNQHDDDKESAILGFRDGRIAELGAKPIMLGGGANFQKHCHWAIVLGISHKFRDFIQAVHRLQRFGQEHPVRLDLIYSEAERSKRDNLERKWRQHDEQFKVMTEIIRKYGLSNDAMRVELKRSMDVERQEAKGDRWTLVNNDSVDECSAMPDNCMGAIVTSIPFSTQYEYTPSYRDFGHTNDDEHFFAQMSFLTPHLLRILQPGRVAAIHVKDRVVPGALTGLGYQSVSPFTARTLMHFMDHGFSYMGMITVVTDVVRENAQTYRLSWSEQCKDGSRMGCGMPEYVLLFRKPPSDPRDGYADVPVKKSKTEYTRGRWQMDAHGFWRSSGNRLLTPEDFRGLNKQQVFRLFRSMSQEQVYDHESVVSIAEDLDAQGTLPPDFMLLQPWSHAEGVWSDVTRMRSLNSRQTQRRREKHLCPLPFDIVDRLITRFTNEGDTVFDPFSGVGTTALRAYELGRSSYGCELNPNYFEDSVFYLRKAESHVPIPSLFDAMQVQIDQPEEATA